MADLTPEDVRKVARLGKLRVAEAEIDAERARLVAVLGYVERLRSLDLEGVEPMTRTSDEPARPRDDIPAEPLAGETLAHLAPRIFESHDADGGVILSIRVPKVLGDGGA